MRGCLGGLLGVVVGLALLGEAVDVGARHVATSKLEERVSQAVPEASGVHAWIRSFPFLKVAFDGDIDEIGVRAARVVEKPLVFTNVSVDLRGVRVSVTDLATSAQVNVTEIKQGTVELTVTESSLEQALPPAVAALAPRATISVNAATRQLVISVAGIAAVDLPLPKVDLLPCTPTVTQVPGGITLGCQFTQVPSAFASS